MIKWLTKDEKFPFKQKDRREFGFDTVNFGHGKTDNFNWDSSRVNIQNWSHTGPYIDFRFKLSDYEYPRYLVKTLHTRDWKIKSKFRVGHPLVGTSDIQWDDWQYVVDQDFPPLWNSRFDRTRQDGRTPRQPQRQPNTLTEHRFGTRTVKLRSLQALYYKINHLNLENH